MCLWDAGSASDLLHHCQLRRPEKFPRHSAHAHLRKLNVKVVPWNLYCYPTNFLRCHSRTSVSFEWDSSQTFKITADFVRALVMHYESSIMQFSCTWSHFKFVLNLQPETNSRTDNRRHIGTRRCNRKNNPYYGAHLKHFLCHGKCIKYALHS